MGGGTAGVFFLLAKGILQSEKLEGNSIVASFSISTYQAEPGFPAVPPHYPLFLGSQFCHASAPCAELGLAPKGLILSAPACPFHTTPYLLMQNNLPNFISNTSSLTTLCLPTLSPWVIQTKFIPLSLFDLQGLLQNNTRPKNCPQQKTPRGSR